MSYEYRTQTYYGSTLPELLTPPFPGFRLRDIKSVTTSESETHQVNDRSSMIYSSAGLSSSIMIPFTQNVQRSRSVQWVIIWERYVPQEGE
jgi:hypothetical protein